MIKIAYCPTMKQYAETISKNINEVDMLEGSAAAAVLAAFREDQVDGVLIGRRAKRYEIDERTKFRKLQSGLTLVYLQKAAIDEAQLSSIPVKTYLKKERLLQVEHLLNQLNIEVHLRRVLRMVLKFLQLLIGTITKTNSNC